MFFFIHIYTKVTKQFKKNVHNAFFVKKDV